MFYAVLLAFLAALSMERSDPARAARDSWWPAQRAPRGFVTVKVSGVPTSTTTASTVDMREEMLTASLAGLAALAVNCGEADELVWNDTVVQRYGEWKARTVARLGLEDRGTFTPWELLERGMRAGWVRGYVAYARDPSGRKGYTAKNASTNESVNVATSLAGIHRAVLIEESLIPRAEALGLRMLADGRVPMSSADAAQLSRSTLSMLDPGVQRNRDAAISQQCWVGYGAGAQAWPMIDRLNDLAPTFGWDEGDEAMHTLAVSVRGHSNTASNWMRNQPFLSAGALDARFPTVAGMPASSVDFADRRPCVALVLSDGDNLQWLCGSFWGPDAPRNMPVTTPSGTPPVKPSAYWDHPLHGSFPIGFGACLSSLSQAAPCVLERIGETQPVGTALIEQFAGYWYPDRFAENTGRREELFREFMRRLDAQNHRTGAVMAGMLMLHSNTPGAAEARRWIAEGLHPLLGAFVCDYAPYNAGRGRIDWASDSRGGEVPFVTAGYCLWAGMDGQHPGMGGPDAVADAIAHDAAASAAPFTRWVSVHVWSSHELAAGSKVTGVAAAAALAERLEARGIRVVRPDELLHRIRRERDGTPALHVVCPRAPFRQASHSWTPPHRGCRRGVGVER